MVPFYVVFGSVFSISILSDGAAIALTISTGPLNACRRRTVDRLTQIAFIGAAGIVALLFAFFPGRGAMSHFAFAIAVACMLRAAPAAAAEWPVCHGGNRAARHVTCVVGGGIWDEMASNIVWHAWTRSRSMTYAGSRPETRYASFSAARIHHVLNRGIRSWMLY